MFHEGREKSSFDFSQKTDESDKGLPKKLIKDGEDEASRFPQKLVRQEGIIGPNPRPEWWPEDKEWPIPRFPKELPWPVDVESPMPRFPKELPWPVDVESPMPRFPKELPRPVDVESPMPRFPKELPWPGDWRPPIVLNGYSQAQLQEGVSAFSIQERAIPKDLQEFVQKNWERYKEKVKEHNSAPPLSDIKDIVIKAPQEAVCSIIYFACVRMDLMLCCGKEVANSAAKVLKAAGVESEALDRFIEHDFRPELHQFLEECVPKPSVAKMLEREIGDIAGLSEGEILETLEDRIVEGVKEASYLTAHFAVGVGQCIENIVDFAVGTACHVMGNDEAGKAVYERRVMEDFGRKLDEVFEAQDSLKKAGIIAEKLGSGAATIALSVVSAGTLQLPELAVGAASALLIAERAGRITGRAVERTGEFSDKEVYYGLAMGLAAYGAGKFVGFLHGKFEASGAAEGMIDAIARICNDSRVAKFLAGCLIHGLEGAAFGAVYAIPEETLKEIQKRTGLDVDDGGDLSRVKSSALIGGAFGALTYAVREAMSGRILDNKAMIDKQNREILDIEKGKTPLDTTQEKGNYGEMKMDQHMREKGYERISKDMVTDMHASGHQGIDGVYQNPKTGEIIIADAKYGTAVLGDTLDGKQMSEVWIDNRLDTSVGKEMADQIRMMQLLEPDKVKYQVVHVESGKVTGVDILDRNGNIIV